MENSPNEALRALGKFYCAVYLVSLSACSLALWLYWDAWRLDTLIPTFGDVSSASVGVALLAAICREAGWYMVLATMRAIKLKEEGRKEGREEGRAEGRTEGRTEGREEGRAEGRTEGREEGRTEGRAEERKRRNKRQAEALAKFGVAVDGVIMLPQTPEVQRFLDEEPEEEE